jgi:hypothetical protein
MKKSFFISIFILVFVCTNAFSQSSKNFSCTYRASDSANETNLTFALPNDYRFGTLIPVELMVKNDPSSLVKMNTVVLKDMPYMVLSDVYKMQSKTSSMALMIFSPDGVSLDVAFINMGEKPNARFFSGKCSVK